MIYSRLRYSVQCTLYSVHYTVYSTLQVVGKSCKPIPVMILGVLVGRKSYPARKYLFILMIVAGVAMFMFKVAVQCSAVQCSAQCKEQGRL